MISKFCCENIVLVILLLKKKHTFYRIILVIGSANFFFLLYLSTKKRKQKEINTEIFWEIFYFDKKRTIWTHVDLFFFGSDVQKKKKSLRREVLFIY